MVADNERKPSKRLVFVCTGNTCRSPMAEALARSLAPAGWAVLSAGLHASVGRPPTPEAVQAAAECGADISGHRVRSMTDALAFSATLLVGMTSDHAAELRARFPFAADKVRMLGDYGPTSIHDIPDPFGGSLADYRSCIRAIRSCLIGLRDSL